MTTEEELRYHEGFEDGRANKAWAQDCIYYIRGFVSGQLSLGWEKISNRQEQS